MKLLLTLLIALASLTSCHAATYYVSPGGTATGPGTLAKPFISPTDVNSVVKPGDSILIQSATTVDGYIYTSVPNLTIGVYDGTTPATIDSGAKSGLYLINAAGLSVTNVKFVGAGGTNTAGVYLVNSIANSHLTGVTITDLTATGYSYGIYSTAYEINSSYNNVSVVGSTCFGNTLCGIQSYAQTRAANTNWTLANDTCYGNLGVDQSTNSGSGICLGQVGNATISNCTAYHNGNPGNGGVGIWCYESNNVTIENCSSYTNHTGGLQDGDGFDLDGGVTNSVIQDCTSYGNDGAGFLDCEYKGATVNDGNKIVDNASTNDGLKNGCAGIEVYSICSDLTISGNKVYAKPGSDTGGCVRGFDWSGSNVVVTGNTLDVSAAPGVETVNWPGLPAAVLTQMAVK